MCFSRAALEELLLTNSTKAAPDPHWSWHWWPGWQIPCVDLGSVLESSISHTSTMVPALNYLVFWGFFWFFFPRKSEFGHGKCMCGNPSAHSRQVGSSSAPPWRSFWWVWIQLLENVVLGSGRKGGAGHLQGLENKTLLFTGGFVGLVWGRAARSLLRGKGNISLMIY